MTKKKRDPLQDAADGIGAAAAHHDILGALDYVTEKWTKQRRSEQKDTSRVVQRFTRMAPVRSDRVTIKDAAWKVMEESYIKVSSDGLYPAHARQIMYAARRMILEMTGMNKRSCPTRLVGPLPDFYGDGSGRTTFFDGFRWWEASWTT
jgi:hypothetical protein